MAIIRARDASSKHRPSNLNIVHRALPLQTRNVEYDGAQILQIRAGTSSTPASTSSNTSHSSSSTTSRTTSSTSRSSTTTTRSSTTTSSSTKPTSTPLTTPSTGSHHLPITPASMTSTPATASSSATAGAAGGLTNAHRGTPALVPALATVFSVLGAALFGLLIFLLCRRRKKAALQQHEEQKRQKWGARWRQRGQDASDTGSPPYMGYMGSGSRSSTSTFLSPRENGAKTGTQMLDAPPTSPTGWGPFHITPYRLSFTVRVPSKFKTSKPKQATTTGPKDLVLPSKPSRFYDRRSPPAGGSQVSIFTRPSYRSRQTDITPPPSYNSRSLSGRTQVTMATNGSRSTNGRSPPTLPPVVTGPIINVAAAPLTGESPTPYQPIPSAIPTPLSQIVTFPASNLPLPRMMVAVSTFTPALSDELNIEVGQMLLMLEEYDDGWCLVERETTNNRRPEQGAVPRFCLDEIVPDEPGTAAASVRSIMTPHSTGPFRSPTRKGSLRRRREHKDNRI